MMRRYLLLLSLVGLLSSSRAAEPPDSLGTLTILSEPSGAEAYVDSLFVGKTPVSMLALPGGPYRVRLFYPSVMAWNAIVREDTIRIASGQTTEKIIGMGSVAVIRSIPSDGMVLHQGTELGVTPLFFRSLSRLGGDIILQKEGFESQRVPFDEVIGGAHVVQLRPKENAASGLRSDLAVPMGQSAAPPSWSLYTSGSTMIVSGVLSAYLKDQANRKFDQYLQSRDPALLSSTRRLDRGAAITLVISQASFALLSYLLLSE